MARKFVTLDMSERSYVPKDWADEEVKLTFKFKPLSKRQLAQFRDNSSRMSLNSNTILLGVASINIDIFRSQVCGWENLEIDDKKVPFKAVSGLVEEAVVNALPLDIIEEVALHIIEVSSVNAEDMGK